MPMISPQVQHTTRYQRDNMDRMLLELAAFDCVAAAWMWRPEDTIHRRRLLARAAVLLRTRRLMQS